MFSPSTSVSPTIPSPNDCFAVRQIVVDVLNALNFTPLQETEKKKNKYGKARTCFRKYCVLTLTGRSVMQLLVIAQVRAM
jgi:hypothetical protein